MAALTRNLAWYPWLSVGRSAVFWLPVFVLYFSRHLEPAEVLLLEAVYYGGVVVFEVPSGYASDRWGRRPTLLVGTLAWALGSGVLALAGTVGGGVALFAAGQLLLAIGLAFQSGTDSALLYDSLDALDRTDELAEREARAQAAGFVALALAAGVGGLVGMIDLRLGHALTAVAGLVGVVAVLRMVEPPGDGRAEPPLAQASAVLGGFRRAPLRWAFAHAVALTALVHVPYELLQPWLDALLVRVDLAQATPPIAGAVVAITMGLAAWAGPRGVGWARRLGPSGLMLVAWALMAVVLGAMAAGPAWWAVPLVALRSVPMALASPTLAAVVHPELPRGLRATWLSVQSLAGRLAFAAVLTVTAALVANETGWTAPLIRQIVIPCTVAAMLVGLVLWAVAPAAARARSSAGGPGATGGLG